MIAGCLEMVRATIARFQLVSRGDTVLVAVSGGADSVALLHLLEELRAELGIRLHVAHLNHGLRPDAGEDAAFVQELAASLRLPATVESTDVRSLAGAQKRSLEDAGRVARYAFFARVAARIGARRVATAHTRDDQTETVTMRLVQGAPWDALAGIPPVRPLGPATVVRPMLELSRADIVTYLRARGIRWREDPTNRDRRMLRNWVRLDLLPTFDRYHPETRTVLWQLGEVMRAGEQWLSSIAHEAFGQMIRRQRNGNVLSLGPFRRVPLAVQQRLIRQAVQEVTGTNDALPRVLEMKAACLGGSGRPGVQMELGGCVVRCGYNEIEIFPRPPAFPQVQYHLPVPGTVAAEAFGMVIAAEVLDRQQAPATTVTRSDETYLDATVVGTELEVRSWRHGDWFVPLGLRGKKKLQDFFVDEKIPRWERARTPLLVDAQDRILWVIGRRIAEAARVTETTTQVVRIRVRGLPPREA